MAAVSVSPTVQRSLQMIDGKADLVARISGWFESSVNVRDTITVIDREAEEFDGVAVEAFIAERVSISTCLTLLHLNLSQPQPKPQPSFCWMSFFKAIQTLLTQPDQFIPDSPCFPSGLFS
jgi:hypothetical protein